MDRYKKLVSNTLIFAIGTFSSKVLFFFLVPLYTRVFSGEEYGVTDLLLQTGNLLLPLATLGVINAVIRFGLEKSIQKGEVLTIGFAAVLCGSGVLFLAAPLLERVPFLSGYALLLCAFVFTSSLRSLCAQFVRANGQIRLFALDGILSTASTIAFNLLFLIWLGMGVSGYLAAIICSDVLSVVFLFLRAGLFRYLRLEYLQKGTAGAMFRYAIPLIPNTILWWVTNVSDRYLITYWLGSGPNGLYAVANKIPSAILLVSGIFMDAWQISAVTEAKQRGHFFSSVFLPYQSVLFWAASAVILIARPVTRILAAEPFYGAWRFIPLLTLAAVFSCLTNFLGSIYMVEKRSLSSLTTTIAGTGLNILLNFLLIPRFGVNGAAFATFISYLSVFLLRAVDTGRYLQMRFRPMRIVLNTSLLLLQSVILLLDLPNAIPAEGLLLLLMTVVNAGAILESLKKIWSRVQKKPARE